MSAGGAWDGLGAGGDRGQKTWIYQFAGSVYGPLSTEELLQKIRIGQVPGDIMIAEDGSDDFRRIDSVSDFKKDLAKAIAHQQALAEREAARKRAKLKKNINLIAGSVLFVALLLGGYLGARYYNEKKQREAIARAEEQRERERQKQLEAERLAAEQKAATAANNKGDDLDLDLDLLPLVSIGNKKKHVLKHAAKGAPVDEGPQGCQLDPQNISSTFKSSFPQIKACVKEQSRRGGELPEMLTLSFTIGNNGGVASFEIDDRNTRNGPFFECMKRTILGLKFHKFEGERCNIDYPITIGKKK